MTNEGVCAATSGAACVMGISLSLINGWLMAVSLVVSIVAGLLAIRAHYRKRTEE
jgi:hypothetical protein